MSRERKTNPRLKIKRSIVPTILQILAQPRTARNSWLEAGWPRRKTEWKKHNSNGEEGSKYLEHPGER